MSYYDVLGVSYDCSEKELKQAYRELVKTYHPDSGKVDEATEERFYEIQTAYSVLSDPDKRSIYDEREAGKQLRGSDVHAAIAIPFQDAVHGCERELQLNLKSICPCCHGKGKETYAAPQICALCFGKGYLVEPKKLLVSIPAGIDDKQSLRIRGKGDPGRNGGFPGDLIVDVTVHRHPRFRRMGYDIYSSITISFVRAALGGTVQLEMLDGTASYFLSEGTQSGSQLRFLGKGIPNLGNPKIRGDHYITFRVEVPQFLSDEQRMALERFQWLCEKPESEV